MLQNFTSYILYLDTVPDRVSLPTLQTMILSIKSTKFPKLFLFHSIDKTWNKIRYQENFTVLCLPHIAKEIELVLNNLIPYLKYKNKN